MPVRAFFVCKLLVLTACTATACFTAARAADNTRYISIAGNNANPCTLARPCHTLQYAINVTPAGGEIRILDSGFYGNNATIRKSLTISGNGNTVYLGSPITINDADAEVVLRGLVLNGQGTSSAGIELTEAAAVHIERCAVHGFAFYGILVSGGASEVFVLDSVLRDNSSAGLYIAPATASRLTADNSHFDNNGNNGVVVTSGHATILRSTASSNFFGFLAEGASSVSVMSTVAAQNRSHGFLARDAGSTMIVDSSVAHGNDVGLVVTSGATARISNSTFTENQLGISVHNSATVETRRNNTVRGNGTNVSGTLTSIGGV